MLYKKFILLLTVFFVRTISSMANAASNAIPFSTRAYWMRAANKVLSDLESPCPFYAFATVIVNHTADGLGELVCTGVNQASATGNPTMHGEMVAIGNCTDILTAKNGSYHLTPEEVSRAFSQLSLYTNAESCPMCASGIRWSGFKEYIYGTSISTLIKAGWSQIQIKSHEIFSAAVRFNSTIGYISGVLSNETDPYFMWQFNRKHKCPFGCRRSLIDDICEPC